MVLPSDLRRASQAAQIQPLVPPPQQPPFQPPVEWAKRLDFWKGQLEESSKQLDTPVEPRGIFGKPLLPSPRNW